MFTFDLLDRVLQSVDWCPWGATAGRHVHQSSPVRGRPLYTPEERRKVWSDLKMVMERLGAEETK